MLRSDCEFVCVERGSRRVDGPDVELAFFVLAVSVETRIERIFGRAHFSQRPRDDIVRCIREQRLAGRAPRVRVQRQKQRVVVEHFLEVRDRPSGVGAVAAEAAGELVVNAAFRHAAQRHADHFEGVRVASRSVPAQAKVEIHRVRKLGRPPETPLHRIEYA